MRTDKKVGPQGTTPGETDSTHQIAATSEYTPEGMRDASLRAVAP